MKQRIALLAGMVALLLSGVLLTHAFNGVVVIEQGRVVPAPPTSTELARKLQKGEWRLITFTISSENQVQERQFCRIDVPGREPQVFVEEVPPYGIGKLDIAKVWLEAPKPFTLFIIEEEEHRTVQWVLSGQRRMTAITCSGDGCSFDSVEEYLRAEFSWNRWGTRL